MERGNLDAWGNRRPVHNDRVVQHRSAKWVSDRIVVIETGQLLIQVGQLMNRILEVFEILNGRGAESLIDGNEIEQCSRATVPLKLISSKGARECTRQGARFAANRSARICKESVSAVAVESVADDARSDDGCLGLRRVCRGVTKLR